MIALILANWRVIAFIGCIIAVFASGEHYGAMRIQGRWDRARIAQEAELQRIQVEGNTKAAIYEQEAAKARANNEVLKGRLSHAIQANHNLAACVVDDEFLSVYSGITLH